MKSNNDSDIKIVLWNPIYEKDFAALNREWIERYFHLEPSDLKILGNPKKEIIDKGGEIFIALQNGVPVGCCALIHHPESGNYELAKMAVSPSAQGHGIGTLLGLRLFEQARSLGVKSIYLEANTRLEASVKLYRKLGFKDVKLESPVCERCDLIMMATIRQ
jgi:N-acetylglutamate synthase-like GNAT family acetyltransferase